MSTFYGVGVGPGNPELITKRAIDLLKTVDRVAAPAAETSDRSMALETARPYLPASTSVDRYFFPLTKNSERVESFWREAAGEIEGHLSRNSDVAFLTLGDPGFYSTCSLVMRQLSDRYSRELIPGVTSIQAAASLINQSLVENNDLFAAITGNRIRDIEQLLQTHDAIAVLKPNRNVEQLQNLITGHPRVRKSTLVSRCGHRDERVEELRDMEPDDIDYFSILLVFTDPGSSAGT